MHFNGQEFLSAIVYSLFGLFCFGIVFTAVIKLAPFDVIKEIEEDQNIALAIVVGSMVIGLSFIISSAISG